MSLHGFEGEAGCSSTPFFAVMLPEPQNRLPRKVGESLSLEIFKSCVDDFLCRCFPVQPAGGNCLLWLLDCRFLPIPMIP